MSRPDGYYSSIVAEVYDLDKPVGTTFGDVEFYRERLSEVSGPVLEPAVGTGRILIPLLEAGLDVEGMDNSREMLEVCRENCRERNLSPVLHEGDMTAPRLERGYGAVILPAGSFLLVVDREESVRTLEGFRDLLLPGGVLMMDLHLPSGFDVGESSIRTWKTPSGDVITLDTTLVEVDMLDQHTVSHLRYDRWREGSLVQSELQIFPLRWYGVHEFVLLLERLGFTDIVVSSDHRRGVPPSHANQTLTFEATRV